MSDAFKDDLSGLINKHSLENMCDTPDYILAEYLWSALLAYAESTRWRDRHMGLKATPGDVHFTKDRTEADVPEPDTMTIAHGHDEVLRVQPLPKFKGDEPCG